MSLGGMLATLATKNSSAEELAQVHIVPLGPDGFLDEVGIYAFQYWPETVTVGSTPNYANKGVHGGSHPLYQWISGGERTISFTAEFSRDLAGEIVEKSMLVPPGKVARDMFNIDIAGAIQWLESLQMVRYTASHVGGFEPPPTLLLVMPNSGLGRTKGGSPSDSFQSFMSGCSSTIDAWFPDGTIRHASVALTFTETVQNADGITWADRKKYEGKKAGGQLYGVKKR